MRVTNFFPVCVDAAGYRCIYSKGVDIIQGQHAHTNSTLHSCSATSSWLYDGTHTGCAFALQYYHLRRGCAGTVDCTRHPPRFTPHGVACGAKGERQTSELRTVELPQLARPKGCFATYYARSKDELSGRTAGRLGYDRPNSAYAIGGAAELALRYSNY